MPDCENGDEREVNEELVVDKSTHHGDGYGDEDYKELEHNKFSCSDGDGEDDERKSSASRQWRLKVCWM